MIKAKVKVRDAKKLPEYIDSTYELAYKRRLDRMILAGEIQGYYLKPFSIRMGYRNHYEPDFMVIEADGTVSVHEVKGKTRFSAKSLTKPKAAVHMLPCFKFVLAWGEKVVAPESDNLRWNLMELGIPLKDAD